MSVIAISGISGFVGSYLNSYFYVKGYDVIEITREDLDTPALLKQKVEKADVIINLSGKKIIQRWSKKIKKQIYKSRIESTEALVSAINANDKKQLFISTSAIGIYENDISCDEEDFIYGQTFLTQLCQDWEREASKVNKRLAILRLGVVLGNGGALAKMLTPFNLGLGGKIGDGKQPFSYIHIEDLARAYEYLITHDRLEGIFNLTTPYPTTNADFTTLLAKKLDKPAFIPLSTFMLKLIFGEGAQVLTNGQMVYPKRLLESGFEFQYRDVDSVLSDLI